MQIKARSSLIKTVSVFIVTLMLFLIGLPYLLSTNLGTSLITSAANKYIPGKMSIGDIDLSWFGSQKVRNVALYDTKDNIVVACDDISLDDSLFGLIFHGLHQAKGHLKGLRAEIVQDKYGNSTLVEALSSQAPAVDRDSVQTAAIYVKGVESQFNLSPTTDHTSLIVQGSASQGDIEGHFSIDCQIKGLEKSKNIQTLAKMGEISLKVDIFNLPVDLVDQFATLSLPEYRGLIRSGLGSQINLKIDSNTIDGKAKLALNAKSENLEANLTGLFSDEKFVVEDVGRVNFLFTQQFYDRLLGDLDDQLNIKLQNPSTLSFVIEKFNLPLKVIKGKAVGVDILGMDLQARADLSPSTLVGSPAIGHIDFEGLGANFSTQAGAEIFTVNISGKAQQNGNPIKIGIATSLPKSLNPKKLIRVLGNNPQFEADLTGIPVGLIDKLIESDNFLVKTLGQFADLKINTLKNGSGTDFIVQAKTEKLAIGRFRFTLGNENVGKNGFKANSIAFNFSNDILNVTSSIKQSNSKTWIFASPIDVQYTLTNSFLGSFGSGTKLAKPALIHLEIDTPQSPLNSSALKNLKLNGVLTLDYLDLVGNNSEPIGVIKYLKVPFTVDAPQNKLTLQLDGVSSIGKQPEGSINGNVSIEQLLVNGKPEPKNATFKASLRLSKLPVGVLETFLGSHDLISILGKSLDVKFDANLVVKAKNRGNIDITFQGDQWTANASLVVTDAIRLRNTEQTATLSWTMTPARFAALRKLVNTDNRPERLVLLDTAHVHASIRSLEVPLRDIDWVSSGLSAEFLIDNLNIQDKRYAQRLNFEGVIAHAESKALSQKIDVRLSAKQKEDLNKYSDLTFHATVDNVLDREGKFNKTDLSVAMEAKAKQLPAGTLCELGGLDPAIQEKLVALTGPLLDADIKLQLRRMNGPIQAFLQGNNGYISLDGLITNSVLTLKNPFEAVVNVTPELGSTVLQTMIPLLSGSIGAEKPLRIGIAPEGFSMPLKEFNINNVQVGRASIEMGVMYFKNEGQLGKILRIFTPSNSEQIMVWFTPAYINIENGVLKLERMDMLVTNTYPIALWGIVNLPGERIDMTVGLSAQSLKKAFNVPTLDKNYMMTLPYRGKIGKASIDKTKITTKITALTAQVLGGPQGFVLGTAIQLATTLAEDPVPPPTTSPLPWNSAEQTVDDGSYPSEQEQQQERRRGNPLKQMQRGAGSLLKGIFG